LSDPARPLIEVAHLTKTYGRVTALHEVAFRVRRGEILGLIGPNGAGKTTLFECVAGVQPADRGEIVFDGSVRSSILFYVPDGIAPWPDQSVAWVLQFVINFFDGRRDLEASVVTDLELTPLLGTTIRALSKGQRKRVLLAIGLLTRQPALLIDEPFEGLDLRQTREVALTLRRHAADGRTLFLSIHQIADAAKLCDRFVLLSSGRVCGEGSLAELTALAAARSSGTPPPNFEDVFLALT
jgi:ABC-2 type transport system ATP-binding protein